MILTDVNLLIYAYNKGDSRHARAKKWFEDLMNGTVPACFCWETINGFIRVSTNRAAIPDPFSLREAFSIVDAWLGSANAVFLQPLEDHLDILRKVSLNANATGGLYSDAILAALAISHRATIATTDRNFRLFDGLNLVDPLVES
jgi:toxin-antitoxin system PIN domain toxin